MEGSDAFCAISSDNGWNFLIIKQQIMLLFILIHFYAVVIWNQLA